MTDLETVRREWEEHGRDDPLWAILTEADKKGNRWDPERFFATGEREVAERLSRLEQVLAAHGRTLRTGVALDVGCGVGRVTQALAERFVQAIGVDISSPMIDHARRYNRHGDRVRYLPCGGDTLDAIADASVDLVWCVIVLQHLAPRHALRYVAEFGRVLAPGGVAMFQVPDRTRAWSTRTRNALRGLAPELFRTVRRLRGLAPIIEMHTVRPRAVRAACASAGLRLIAELPDDAAAPSYDSVLYVAVREG